MTDEISKAGNEAELAATEQRIDDILKVELEKQATQRPPLWDWPCTAWNT